MRYTVKRYLQVSEPCPKLSQRPSLGQIDGVMFGHCAMKSGHEQYAGNCRLRDSVAVDVALRDTKDAERVAHDAEAFFITTPTLSQAPMQRPPLVAGHLVTRTARASAARLEERRRRSALTVETRPAL